MVVALALIKVQAGKVPDVARSLGEITEVTEVYSVAGPYDLVAKIQVEEYERMAEVITGKLQLVDGIRATQTLMAFHTYKF